MFKKFKRKHCRLQDISITLFLKTNEYCVNIIESKITVLNNIRYNKNNP